MSLVDTTFQLKCWLIEPQLETGFMSSIIKRTNSYWIHGNNQIDMTY